jgi:hypothetical protein
MRRRENEFQRQQASASFLKKSSKKLFSALRG